MICPLAHRLGLPLSAFALVIGSGGCPTTSDNGDSSAFVSSLIDATPTVCDTEPVADAGADIEATDTDGDGFAYVYLNATASKPGDKIAVYGWSDDGRALAAGDYILVRLSVGDHPLTLHIEDDCGRDATDTVNVTVKAALSKTMDSQQ